MPSKRFQIVRAGVFSWLEPTDVSCWVCDGNKGTPWKLQGGSAVSTAPDRTDREALKDIQDLPWFGGSALPRRVPALASLGPEEVEAWENLLLFSSFTRHGAQTLETQ